MRRPSRPPRCEAVCAVLTSSSSSAPSYERRPRGAAFAADHHAASSAVVAFGGLAGLACLPMHHCPQQILQGAVHKIRQHFFHSLVHPLPYVSINFSSVFDPFSLKKMLTYFMNGPQEELLGRKEAYAALLSTTAPHCTAHKYVCVLGW